VRRSLVRDNRGNDEGGVPSFEVARKESAPTTVLNNAACPKDMSPKLSTATIRDREDETKIPAFFVD
jgi:hypothetical protein